MNIKEVMEVSVSSTSLLENPLHVVRQPLSLPLLLAREHYEKAKSLGEETGCHRRDDELYELKLGVCSALRIHHMSHGFRGDGFLGHSFKDKPIVWLESELRGKIDICLA